MPELLQESIQSFLDYLKYQKRYSVYTIRSYHDDLAQFFGFLLAQFRRSFVGRDRAQSRSKLAGFH